ncbi:MAG: Bug family tripartite tricarboxylate transporter substrate binding protein [Burkholderiales bacterium]
MRTLHPHHIIRHLACAFALLSALLPIGQSSAFAQAAYPSSTIRMVVPFPPGGVSDAAARLVAEQLTKRMGQVVVENRPGATGNIAGQYVAQAEPDGYTILLAYNGLVTINPFVFSKMPFDTVKDLTPIGMIGDYPTVITVNPAVDVKTLQDLIALSKSKPAGLDYGTSGTGSNEHLIGTLLVQRAGAKLVHVPYKGGGPAMADAMAGHIPIGMSSVAGGAQFLKSGKLKGIAVSSAERWSTLPDVPTIIESGVPDVAVMSWIGLVGPGKMPTAVVDRINTELNAALATPELSTKVAALGVRATPGTADNFRDQIKRDLDRNGPLIKAAGIVMQ